MSDNADLAAELERLKKQFGLALEALEALADGEGTPTDIAQQTIDNIARVGMEAIFLRETDASAEPVAWSFDDEHIGRRVGDALTTRDIPRPPGLSNAQWYSISRELCRILAEKARCEHNWRYIGTDYHGSRKGEDMHHCTKCGALDYPPLPLATPEKPDDVG